ncbi:MAG TPA: aryl-sulfate sulfotransferase [Bacteroidota bacterium]|nr:aryl-sulfate sulfotransferase [Bacteroidota bacterium]
MPLSLILAVFTTLSGFAANQQNIIYQSPTAGARYVNPYETLSFRFNGNVGPAERSASAALDVRGSLSGKHDGRVAAADDGRTLLFTPSLPFTPGELVKVTLPDGWAHNMTTSFSFSVSTVRQVSPAGATLLRNELSQEEPRRKEPTVGPGNVGNRMTQSVLDSLPLDFPLIRISNYDSTSEGQIFISNLTFLSSIPNTPYLAILENDGTPIFYRKMPSFCFDFKMQPNGLLTYYELGAQRFYALDSTYAVVDSFACGNGYLTDLHELRILDNGHALIMSYDSQKVDMRTVVAGGDSSATVVGLIIQELDLNKNVVFQWRSWDHFQITDATHENLLAHTIDYVHGNAIELDTDGNILISSRHMDEITKIDRTTGNILWRLGGKNNQFTFLNDSIGFSHQHAIRRLPNGSIILFDNGNFHSPHFSRAIEYQLDETQKTANLVWQYRNSPDNFGGAMGYAQRLDNGNTLIGWGSSNPSLTEVKSDGTKVLELSYDSGIYSYRAYRFPWKSHTGSPAAQNRATYHLSQNYPNPFNNSTNILIDVPYESTISLKIYDELGRKVQTIADGIRKNKGEYFFSVDGATLSSGIYFYRLQGEGFSQTRKMLLTK